MQNTSRIPSAGDVTQARPCLKRVAASRSSKHSSGPRVTHGNSGAERRKRVKFVERGTDLSSTCERVVSLHPIDAHHSLISESPKTLEYKSFKKLLGESIRSSHSGQMSRESNTSSFRNREDSGFLDKHTCNNEVTTSNLPVEKATPIKQLPSLSITEDLDEKELHHEDEITFCGKRQNLIKAAASVFSLEVIELLSQGNSLIPVFLQRLGDNNRETSCKTKDLDMDSNIISPMLDRPKMQKSLDGPTNNMKENYVQPVFRDITEKDFHGEWWKIADTYNCLTEYVEAKVLTNFDLPEIQSHSDFFPDSPHVSMKENLDLKFNSGMQVAVNGYKQSTRDSKIPISSLVNLGLSPFRGFHEKQSFPSHRNFNLQEFDVPYDPSIANQFSRQNFSLSQLEWSDIYREKELFAASDKTDTKELYQLPLSLYNVPQPYCPKKESGVSDCGTSCDIFLSFGDIRDSKDMIYPSTNHSLLPYRTKLEAGLEWELKEEELFTAADSTDIKELYHLPLTVYNFSHSHSPTGEYSLIGWGTKCNFLHAYDDIRDSKAMIYPYIDPAIFPCRTKRVA